MALVLDRPYSLDVAYIKVQRIAGSIRYGVLSAVFFVLALVIGLNAEAVHVAAALGGWFFLSILMFTHAIIWPRVDYRHRSFVLTERGLEIRRGVFWRSVVNVSRTRVQHTDVNQGPIERSYGLGHLVIHTAGNWSASVRLAGLAHTTALSLRDELTPEDAHDAV